MDTQKVISDIFSIFHDGGIESWSGDKEKLILKISCLYIAETINKDFEFFYIELTSVEKLEMECWRLPEEQPLILTTQEAIFSGDIEISSGEVEGDDAIVYVYQHNDELGYEGGTLRIKAESVKIFQHDMREVTVEFLNKIRNEYWDSF